MNTLRWWVSLGVTLVVGLSVFSFAGRYHQVLAEWTSGDGLEAARDKVVRFGRWIQVDAPDAERRASIAAALTDRENGTHLAVLDAEGRVLPEFTTPGFPAGDFAVPRGYWTNRSAWQQPFATGIRGAPSTRYATAWFPLGHTQLWPADRQPRFWSVAVLVDAATEKRLSSLGWSMLTRTLGLAAASGILTFLLVGLWTRALGSAAETAEAIAQGTLSLAPLAVPRTDSEVRRLIQAFNGLMERLRQLHGAQERFIADAAHELRTPLTILRGEIQVALRKERDPDRYRVVLQSNLEEVMRLSSMVEALLTLARADGGEGAGTRRAFALETVCRGVVDPLRPVAERKGVELAVETEPGLDATFVGDPQAFHRVFLNLVDNAIRYSESGDTVRIRIAGTASSWRIVVVDEGPGIAPEHLPRLFDRFYRVESARERSTGGAGLGLSIVKALVESAGGTVEVASDVGHGTTFTVVLPRGLS